MSATAKKAPGTAKMDTAWEDLGFEFRPTNSHIQLRYKDGEWMEPELVNVGNLREERKHLVWFFVTQHNIHQDAC
jgi:hypothetical protein